LRHQVKLNVVNNTQDKLLSPQNIDNLVLPVRLHEGNTYFSGPVLTINGQAYEPSFWGGIQSSSNPALAELYLNELKKIYHGLSPEHAANDEPNIVVPQPLSDAEVKQKIQEQKKQPLINKLQTYEGIRKKQGNYTSVFSRLFSFLFCFNYHNNKAAKIAAVNAAIAFLNDGDASKLQPHGRALAQGRLGEIVANAPEIQLALRMK
jgi:hypothetical protein